jgi:hypothetical protein
MKMTTALTILLSFGSFLAAADAPVHLQCRGTFKGCVTKDDRGMLCDPIYTQSYAISWNGDRVVHNDDYGLLEYRSGCESTEQYIYCKESRRGNLNSSERSTRIQRSNGRVTHRAYFLNPGKTGPVTMHIEYDGECIPSKDRNLF